MAKKKTEKATKSPNDYPMLGYRVLPNIHQRVVADLEMLLKLRNEKREKPLKKNDVFIDALDIGLRKLLEQELEAQG